VTPRLALLTLLLLAAPAAAQEAPPAEPYRVYDAAGAEASLETLVAAAAGADALFLGEQHDDATGHALRAALLTLLREALPAERPLVLALEMFERDAQPVLDEYAAGLIREQDLLAAARPWANYATDYRPMVELAVGEGWPLVAANVPARYASLVAREGGEALARLPGHAAAWLPGLPVPPPSDPLAEAFRETMEAAAEAHGGHAMDVERMLEAQNLRDATMAASVAEALERHPGALVVLVAGAFHSEGGLGVPEHLARLAPGARALTVTMRPHPAFPALAPDAFRPGDDFVVVIAPPTE
jgi:uncharacterized iron-regulated protein